MALINPKFALTTPWHLASHFARNGQRRNHPLLRGGGPFFVAWWNDGLRAENTEAVVTFGENSGIPRSSAPIAITRAQDA